MCGITALMNIDGGPVDPRMLHAATDALSHRGPDDEGFVLTGPGQRADHRGGRASKVPLPPLAEATARDGFSVGLGNRRLAILDPTPSGHGPMSSADGQVWLTYNGEVYNYRELARDLTAEGVELHTGTDTEVVLQAYLRWGVNCFHRFNGMWGLAIWDGRQRRLVLSRDRLGIKPLYVTQVGPTLAAASEIKALLRIGADRAVEWPMVYGYLAGGLSDWGDATFFARIRRVQPGSVEVYAAEGQHESRRFWSLDDVAPYEGSHPEAVRRFRDLFMDCVRLQLRSDVPVGTCLSGGLDSSSIALAVARERAEGQAQHAFSALFPGTVIDESSYARAVAKAAGLSLHELTPSADEFAADLDRLVSTQDEPFPGSSMYAQWRVMATAAAAGIKVLLDGQGADELLAGYSGFRAPAAADLLKAGRVRRAAAELWAVRHQTALAGAVGRALAAVAPEPARRSARQLSRRRTLQFISPELRRQGEPRLADVERTSGGFEDTLRRALLQTSVPVLLRSEDRNSMAHSVEARVPFLDHRLVELAASLPLVLKLDRGLTKVVLREAMRDLLPESVLARRDKIGFATPEAAWLLGPARSLVDDAISSLEPGGPVRREQARVLWRRAQTGDPGAVAPMWRLLCFQRWRELVVDG